MKASQNCIEVIKHYEAFKSKPYLCPAGVATIGYGTTVYPSRIKVKLTDTAIFESSAIIFLINDIEQIEKEVNRLIKPNVAVSQNLFDALVSFSYNLGWGALAGSTLLKVIHGNGEAMVAPDWNKKISKEFSKWIYGKVKGVPTKMAGLIARRTTEAYLATNGIVKFFN